MTDRLNHFTMELSEHIAQTIQGAVKTTVNGKIDSLRGSLEAYKEEDAQWKERVEPIIEAYRSAKWVSKGAFGIVSFLAIMAGIIEFIIKVFFKK